MKRIFTYYRTTTPINIINSIVILSFLLFSGCTTKPEDVVEEYLEYTFLDNEGKKAYQLLSSDDKKYKTEKEFIQETRKKNILTDNILEKYDGQFNYEIVETRQSADTAFIKVNLTKPDAGEIVHEMVGFAMASAFSKESREEKNAAMEHKLEELLQEKELETITEEKEFRVINENGEYKVFLDLGYPQKLERIKAECMKLNTLAEEQVRLIDFEGAIRTYKKMLMMRYDEETASRLRRLEKIERNTVGLNEDKQTGNLVFKPLKVEVRKVRMSKINWYGGSSIENQSSEPYFVLTYQLTNVSQGEAFAPEEENRYRKKHMVQDNFGNTMQEIDVDFDIQNIEGNVARKLKPGETRVVKGICEAPFAETADEFIWRTKVVTNNRGDAEYLYVRFLKKDIEGTQEQVVSK